MVRRQVNLRFAPIGQRDVCFDEELAAGQWPALKKSGLGLHGPDDSDPCVALLLGERAPTFGDRAEFPTDSDMSRGVEIEMGEGGVADLAIASALPNHASAFAGFRIGHFHNQDTGAASLRSGAW